MPCRRRPNSDEPMGAGVGGDGAGCLTQLVCFLSLYLCCVAAFLPVHAADGGSPTSHIVKAEVEQQGHQTCFNITSIGRLSPEVFAVPSPRRVVVDAANTTFKLSRGQSKISGGLVDAFRYGLIGPKYARIVVDVSADTQLGQIVSRPLDGEMHRLTISLTDGKSVNLNNSCLGATGELKRATVLGRQLAAKPRAPSVRSNPVVVIDPGHGGLDPGAVVNKVFLEKIIALAVGRRLAKRLRKAGRFDVVMTRKRDTFVSLDDRVERARTSSADIFISLHADSIEGGAKAFQAQGAAVYVLSHKASDAEAKRLADKENSADLLAGIIPKQSEGDDGVRNILVDLLKRETVQKSARFQKLLVGAMRGKVSLSRKPFRSAAFRVLKQTETPAVLIELGYMTNPSDLKRMRQSDWQNRMAEAIAGAIERYFAQR